MSEQEWVDEALEVWATVAPSYVQHDVTISRISLHPFYKLGGTVGQWRRAVEHSFTLPGVTQRNAINHVWGLYRSLVLRNG